MVAVEVDKGWAWGTVVGGFIANFLIGGFSRSFGIVLKEYQSIFECPSAYMTLAGGLIYTFMYAMSIFVHVISSKIGGRIVMFTGAILCAGSLIGASLAPSVGLWVLFIGVGVGLSLSFIYFPAFVMLGRCFSKYIGVANGIAVAGMSVGQAVFPTMVVVLIEQYSVRGAMLLTGALSLHFAIAAALLPSKVIIPTAKPDSPSSSPGTKKKDIEAAKDEESGEEEEEEEGERMVDTEQRPRRTTMQRCVSWVNKKRLAWQPVPNEHFDKLLVALYTVSRLLNEIGHVGLTICFPPYGSEVMFTNRMIVVALAASGGVDLVSRLFVGWFSDLHVCRRSLILVITALVEAVSGLALTYTNDYTSYVAVNVLFGLCGGATTTLMVVVLTDYVGNQNLSKAFAVMMLCMGFGLGPSQYLLGFIRDVSHTYGWTIRTASFFICVGAFVLSLDLPIAYLREQHRRRKNELNDEDEKAPQGEEVPLHAVET